MILPICFNIFKTFKIRLKTTVKISSHSQTHEILVDFAFRTFKCTWHQSKSQILQDFAVGVDWRMERNGWKMMHCVVRMSVKLLTTLNFGNNVCWCIDNKRCWCTFVLFVYLIRWLNYYRFFTGFETLNCFSNCIFKPSCRNELVSWLGKLTDHANSVDIKNFSGYYVDKIQLQSSKYMQSHPKSDMCLRWWNLNQYV